MDQATKAFHERDEYYRASKLYDSFYAEYTKHVEKLHQQLKTVDEILRKWKADTGIYEYPSSPSLVLHLGELDDKPKEYFERTKKEVSCKNVLAKWVHQHKILPDPKTKVWVDEQNRINTEKTLGYDKSYEEARDTMYPDPQIDVEPPVKSQKRGTVVLHCGCILFLIILTKQTFSMGCVMKLAFQLTHNSRSSIGYQTVTDAHENKGLKGSNSLLWIAHYWTT